MPAAVAEIPPKPNTAATNAITKNIKAQRSMVVLLCVFLTIITCYGFDQISNYH